MTRGRQIVERLRKALKIGRGEFIALDVARDTGDPFKVLVATILSQNTVEVNAYRAYERLEKEVGVEPEKIARADLNRIKECIRVAGLAESKARAIKELAKLTLEKYGGDLSKLLRKSVEEVRGELTAIKGIGLKTVDVLLANFGYPVIPLDTHLRRVAVRLGLAPNTSSYIKIQEELMKNLPPENLLEAHVLLIKLGRTYCKAKNPKCDKCPIRDLCPSASN